MADQRELGVLSSSNAEEPKSAHIIKWVKRVPTTDSRVSHDPVYSEPTHPHSASAKGIDIFLATNDGEDVEANQALIDFNTDHLSYSRTLRGYSRAKAFNSSFARFLVQEPRSEEEIFTEFPELSEGRNLLQERVNSGVILQEFGWRLAVAEHEGEKLYHVIKIQEGEKTPQTDTLIRQPREKSIRNVSTPTRLYIPDIPLSPQGDTRTDDET